MISDTRGKIEKTKGRMQYLERTSDTSLIEIYLVEERPLEIDFVVNKIEVEEDEWVQFSSEINGGSPPYGYRWDFGDGESSTNPSLNIKYDDPGKYTVSLTVTDADGNTDTQTKEGYITVVGKSGWSASDTADSAWGGLVGVGKGLGHFFIWVGILAPVWIPIGLLIYVLMRRQRKGAAR